MCTAIFGVCVCVLMSVVDDDDRVHDIYQLWVVLQSAAAGIRYNIIIIIGNVCVCVCSSRAYSYYNNIYIYATYTTRGRIIVIISVVCILLLLLLLLLLL